MVRPTAIIATRHTELTTGNSNTTSSRGSALEQLRMEAKERERLRLHPPLRLANNLRI